VVKFHGAGSTVEPESLEDSGIRFANPYNLQAQSCLNQRGSARRESTVRSVTTRPMRFDDAVNMRMVTCEPSR